MSCECTIVAIDRLDLSVTCQTSKDERRGSDTCVPPVPIVLKLLTPVSPRGCAPRLEPVLFGRFLIGLGPVPVVSTAISS